MTDFGVDIAGRERRIERALTEVIKNYTVTGRGDPSGYRLFTITGGESDYEVRVHPEWRDTPTCTCPDFEDGAQRTGGYCKHIMAVLIGQPALACQLLEVFL